MALTDKLVAIGDAIREKTGTTEAITLEDMAITVSSLPVIKEGITWDEFNENGEVIKATYYTNSNKIKDAAFYVMKNNPGVYTNTKTINFPETITEIGESAFSYCTSLESVDFSNIEIINRSAFLGCSSLALSAVPPKLTYLGSGAFSDCPNVVFSELPSNLTCATSALASMTGLTTLKLPDGMTEIPGYFCNGCTNLTNIELPNSITSLGTWCFSRCMKLALTSLPSSLVDIQERSFWYCQALAITEIPATVQTIGKWAFGYCNAMNTLTFKGTPISLNSEVFTNCNNLTTINVPWAEGEVANAPWGATKATINYNYTAES